MKSNFRYNTAGGYAQYRIGSEWKESAKVTNAILLNYGTKVGTKGEYLLQAKYIPNDVDVVIPTEINKPTNKYERTITGFGGTTAQVDVYRVLEAFDVTNPQLQHLIKKALCAGLRGHKDTRQDLLDIEESIQSAIKAYDDEASNK